MAGRHTFVGGLEGNARYIPGALAVVQGRRLRTHEDLNARPNQFGNALLKLGVRRGERIALLLTNRIEFLECSYGCCKDALVSVPVNYRFQEDRTAPCAGERRQRRRGGGGGFSAHHPSASSGLSCPCCASLSCWTLCPLDPDLQLRGPAARGIA